MINELAAQMTIEQLGWPTAEEIVKAKKLIDVYEKNVQRMGNNKLEIRPGHFIYCSYCNSYNERLYEDNSYKCLNCGKQCSMRITII